MGPGAAGTEGVRRLRPEGRRGFRARACARGPTSSSKGFGPGVAARLGVGPDDLPASVVHCSITGFGPEGRHAQRAGHDLNYLGWAGVLEDTPSCPPLPIADLAAGGLGAVTEVLAALVRRARTGEGARLRVSMTHGATISSPTGSAATPATGC